MDYGFCIGSICKSGNTKMAQYILRKAKATGYGTVDNVYYSGNMRLLRNIHLIDPIPSQKPCMDHIFCNNNIKFILKVISMTNVHFWHPLNYACFSGSAKVLDYVLKQSVDNLRVYHLIVALKTGSISLVRNILAQGVQLGRSALKNACRSGNTKMVKFVLKNTNLTFDADCLYDACCSGNLGLIRVILKRYPHLRNEITDITEIADIFYYSNEKTIRYIISTFNLPESIFQHHRAMKSFCRSNSMNIVRQHTQTITRFADNCEDFVLTSILSGNVGMLRYVLRLLPNAHLRCINSLSRDNAGGQGNFAMAYWIFACFVLNKNKTM